MVYLRSLAIRLPSPWWRIAILSLALVTTSACERDDPDQPAAFAAAAVAARAAVAPQTPEMEHFQFRRRTGLKGSKAVLVCGEMRTQTVTEQPHIVAFIYFWKLDPAVANPGRRQGEVIVITHLDRHAIGELANLCGLAETQAVSDWTYFN